jgi:cation-transporting ATPase 13A1
MSPQGKAEVIREMQKRKGHFVLMCGDGGNDVGALKQADVGLALLSGYGNANTTSDSKGKDGEAAAKDDKALVKGDVDPDAAEKALNEQTKSVNKRAQESAKIRKELMAKKQKELMSKQQQMVQEELEAMRQRGEEVGFSSSFTAMKKVHTRVQAELKKERIALNRKYGLSDAFDNKDAEDLFAELGTEQDMLPTIRPGDASIAAPFTSRQPSIKSVVDLVRQGRCTLLSALQQQQIMMLECMITAYTLSALSLEGARSSERQMMASGWLIMIASLAFSYSTPIDRMHKVRPIRSLFHPAIFISILGQALIHLYCMVTAVNMATEEMGPEALKEVVEFHKRVRSGEQAELDALEDDEDPWAEMMFIWQQPFLPNLLNTVVFLVETSQIISVLFVNYKGRPWMKVLRCRY